MATDYKNDILGVIIETTGKFGDDAEKIVDEVFRACPANVRETYGTEDKYEIASKFYETWLGSDGAAKYKAGGGVSTENKGNPGGGAVSGDNQTGNKRVQAETYTKPTLGKNQEDAINDLLEKSQEFRQKVSNVSSIEKMLAKMPPTKEFLAGVKVVPQVKDGKSRWDEWEKILLPDATNLANFEAAKKAVDAGMEVDVATSEEYKIDGYIIKVPSTETGKDDLVEKIVSIKGLQAFVVENTMGYLATKRSSISVGAAIKSVTKSDAKGRASYSADMCKVSVAVKGRKRAIQESNDSVIVMASKSPTESQKRSVRTVLGFYIYDTTRPKDAEGKYTGKRKVTISGSYDNYPKWELEQDYEKDFTIKSLDVVSDTLTKEEEAKMMDNMKAVIYAVGNNKLMNGTALTESFVASIKGGLNDAVEKDKMEGTKEASGMREE